MKNFILPFTFFSIAIFSTLYGLNIAIDPYDKLGINLFNFETKAVASSRENKYYMLEKSKENYEAFILGSSTAHRYHTKDVEDLTGLKTFNYAVQHTTPEDYKAIIKHIRSKYSPKLIILQLAFVDLDKSYKTDKRLYTSPLNKFLDNSYKSQNTYVDKDVFSSQLLTLDALRDSFRVIFVNLFGEARHIYLKHGNYKKEKPAKSPLKLVQFTHYKWKLSMERLKILKDIKNELQSSGIKLVIVQSPLANVHYQKIISNKHMAASYKKFKQSLNDIFGSVHSLSNSELKEYSSTKFFRDSTHPKRELTNIILKKIWSNK